VWTAKDHLIHLATWRNHGADVLEAVRSGSAAPPRKEEDEENARIYAGNKDRRAADIKRDAEASWDRLEAIVKACSEADLARQHPNNPSVPVALAIAGNWHGHLALHLVTLYLGSGTEAAAESAQVWARDVDLAEFPEPAMLAYESYNLACFYSRVGRADKAVPMLRESVELLPELLEYARKDPDLDPIRSDSGLKELLAT
jgi:hypothetical protein